MYNKQLLEAGILYEFSLKPKIKDENKSNTGIPYEEQIKQLKDRLNEINSKIQTLNEKIAELNKEKKDREKLIEGDNKKTG